MGVEKEGSKGGGYVGGFFQLFDWTAKSRKKLFSSKSDQPERSKQGKRSNGNLPMTRFHLMEEDDSGAGLNVRGYSDYSCASSVTDDEGYGARAPGVVARLMGLDSMPTSSFSEANSTPFFDTQSLRDASQRKKHFDYYHDHQMMYSGNVLGKEDPPRNFIESRPQKVLSRPIEKFQTEILPPKSAKSIPVTHHKLLSPIKSPGFIPSKTAAHIMEAAAKIIESNPHPVPKAKMPSVGSSSVPLKVRDLKEKLEVAQKMPLVSSSSVPFRVKAVKEQVEAAPRTSRVSEPSRRPVELNTAKYLKGQLLDKGWNGSAEATTSFRPFADTEEGSSGLKSKGKSISLAIQAKVNVQRREGLNSSCSQGMVDQKEKIEETSGQPFKSQLNNHKNLHKKHTTVNSSGVLRPNNQKQNSIMDKDKLPSKPSVSNLLARKTLSNSPSGRQKTSSKTVGPKIGSRKMGLDVADNEKGTSPYGTRNISRKKRLIDGNRHLEKVQAVDNMMIDSNQKTIESNPVIDRHFGRTEESKRNGMDVVSFTFTAPLARSMPDSNTPGQLSQKNVVSPADNWGKQLSLNGESMKLSSMGYNVIGGDALSNLLEQKLRELTSSIGSSQNSVKAGLTTSSMSFSQEAMPAPKATSSLLNSHYGNNQDMYQEDRFGGSCDSSLFSSEKAEFRLGQTFQGIDEMEECSSKHSRCRRPSPVSVLDNSSSTASSSSLDSTESSCTERSKLCSSIQAQGIFGYNSSKKFHYVDAEMELSDSASSTSTTAIARKHAISFSVTEPARSTNWELGYVANILSNVELMFQDFALGRTSEIINPHLFDQLESRKLGLGSGTNDKLERKVLFDCVAECLDLRCRRYVGGGFKTWTKGVAVVRRNEWLAEEMHREISVWRGMGDCMVDELVDKDMSNQYGRWLDFEVDAFSLGEEVEGHIFDSLVNEVVADIFQF